jgi:hypothetical protein
MADSELSYDDMVSAAAAPAAPQPQGIPLSADEQAWVDKTVQNGLVPSGATLFRNANGQLAGWTHPTEGMGTFVGAPKASDAASTPTPNGEVSYEDLAKAQPQAAAPDTRPTSESLGFMEGVTKPLSNMNALLNTVPGLRTLTGADSPDLQKALQGSRAYFAQREAAQRPGAIGNFAGNVVGTLPTMALPGGPLAQGAAAGALLTDHPNDPLTVAKDAAGGAIGAKVGGAALSALGKVAAPALKPAVRALVDAGVSLTPGQLAGGAARTIEDSLTSWPILGDMIKNAKVRSVASFNTAAANSALSHIGETVPDTVAPGRATISHVENRLGQGYDAIAPQLKADIDVPFVQNVGALRSSIAPEALDNMPTFDRVLKDEVLARADPNTMSLNGQGAKDAMTAVGQEIRKYSPSPDPKVQAVVRGLQGLQDEIGGSLARNSPADAASKLNDLNAGWAKFSRLRAASAAASEKADGLFTPYQLSQAVKKGDKSVGKGGFARGDALMQDFAGNGEKVLPSTVPDSGTVGRGLIAELPMLLGFGSESKSFGRQIAGLVLGGPVAGLPYTNAGGKAVQGLLAGSRPWSPAQAAAVLAKLKPAARVAGAAGAAKAISPYQLPQLPRR